MGPDFTPEESAARAGERAVFWSWAGVIGAGLVLMIVVPLLGR